MSNHPRRSLNIPTSLNSPDEERNQSFDEYALNQEPYTSIDPYPTLETEHAVFVSASELAETNQVYRHAAAVHAPFSSPFVSDVYSSSPSTTSFFGKPLSYGSSPTMIPTFVKQSHVFQPIGGQFESIAMQSTKDSMVTSNETSDPYFQEHAVPKLEKELYNKVNPSFISKATPLECLQFFSKTMTNLGFQYSIHPSWMIRVTGLLCVEEVTFTIALKIDEKEQLVVDFNLQQGSERNFLRLFDIVRNHAQSLDTEPSAFGSATSPAWLDIDSMPELFPGSSVLHTEAIMEFCDDYVLMAEDEIKTTRGDQARLEMASHIKNACLSEKNRQEILNSTELSQSFGAALYRMAQDEQTSIVRFAVFILSLFEVSTLVQIASHLQVEDNMLTVLQNMETHDPIPKMKSIAASLRSKLVASN